ncbi:FG-GAP repeat domain-containing protein [Candidatus Riflebacteria bacterium]
MRRNTMLLACIFFCIFWLPGYLNAFRRWSEPENYLSDISIVEKMSSELQKIPGNFFKAILLHENLKKYVQEDNFFSPPFVLQSKKGDDYSPYKFFVLAKGGKSSQLLRGFIGQFRQMYGDCAKLVKLKTKIFQCYIQPDYKRIYANFRYAAKFITRDDSRVQDRGEWQVEFVRVGMKYHIQKLGPLYFKRAQAKGLLFREVFLQNRWFVSEKTAQSMINVLNLAESISVGGLNFLDLNDDSFPDIFFSPAFGRSFCYLNDGKGNFYDASYEMGLAGSQRGNGGSSIFVDLDNDGDLDLVNPLILRDFMGNGYLALYERKGNKYHIRPRALKVTGFPDLKKQENEIFLYSFVVPVDINNDGLMDLYFAGYKNSDLEHLYNRVDAKDGMPALLFINKGNLIFSEEAEMRGILSNRETMSAVFYDFDNDGDRDLFEGTDYSPDVLFENIGNGYFRKNSSLLPHSKFIKGSMSQGLVDLDGDHIFDFYISGMDSKAGRRRLAVTKNLGPVDMQHFKSFSQGSSLYKFDGTSRFIFAAGGKSFASTMGIDKAEWAWGTSFPDIDADGDQDIYVVNGYTSHEDPKKPDY